MKIICTVSRIFTGIVFIFSGFVKAVDPMGFAIKLGEYLDAFHLGFLHFSALPLAIAVSAAELMIGLNLLAALRMKFTSRALLLFMCFFTGLTFILALTNPVSDCGCFGDALVLTNWQTFGKNVVLVIPAILLFVYRKQFITAAKPAREWGIVCFNFAAGCIISIYCVVYQPLIDFRPYKTGTYIPEKMNMPPGAPVDQYMTLLVYEKDGQKKEFTDKNFPWQDSTWKWVETRQKMISKGYEPPIHNFSITSSAGTDITLEVLTDTGYIFLFIIPDLDRASGKGLMKLNDLALRSRELGIKAMALTSSTNSQVDIYKKRFQPAYEFYTTDETTLKTITRANPGILLLLRGTIIDKWSHRNAPAPNDLKRNLLSPSILHQQTTQARIIVIGLILLMLSIYRFVFRDYQGQGTRDEGQAGISR
jgi:uncharacterized membrane protein YphA (DoxX/SURF4 family)